MFYIILSAVLFAILGYYFSKQIRKYALYLYAVALVIALVVGKDSANILSLGYVPFGILLLVMYMGVFDKGKFKNLLLGIRGEYAIIGTILLIPHMFGYLEYFIEDIGLLNATITFYLGVIAASILVVLTATSFRKVRSKLGFKLWKKIHTYSYLFYLLVGLHLILIQNDRMNLYLGIFGVYAILKVYVLVSDKITKNKKTAQRTKKELVNT